MVKRYHVSETYPALPILALSGRSNVGKSSLLNRLVGAQVASVSQKPGHTRAIYLYPDPKAHWLWADLPGYGYAAVSRPQRQAWLTQIRRFLREARPFVWIVVDSQIPPQALDQAWAAWLVQEGFSYGILANKVDRLNQAARHRQRLVLTEAYPAAHWIGWVSARTGEGLVALRAWIAQHLMHSSG